jgi:adenylate cyclase
MKRILVHRGFQIGLLLLLMGYFTLASFSHDDWRQDIRNFSFDTYNMMHPRQAGDGVVIVDIDETSLSKLGQMPWPRTRMAEIVDHLSEAGAKAIVFDIVFAEPDRSSPMVIASQLEEQGDFDALRSSIENLPDNDNVFARSIREAGNVVTGFSFSNQDTDISPRQKGIYRGKNIQRFVMTLSGASSNLRELTKYAAGNGSFFVSSDSDGIIRRIPMLVAHERDNGATNAIYPSLSLEAIRVSENVRGGKVTLADTEYARLDPGRFGIEAIEVGHKYIPTTPRGEFLVHFAKPQPDWYVPAHLVAGNNFSKNTFEDKIVLIGTSAVGLKDIRSTPLAPFVPGVEVHLNIIDQIQQGQFLHRSVEAEGLEAITIVIMGLFIICAAFFMGALAQTVVVMGVIGAAIYAGWYSFMQSGLLVDVAYPSLSIFCLFMVSSILTYIRSEAERKHVREAFGLYISPAFMEELTQNPEKLKLGGENRELSVMFTDIQGFTGISEKLNPEQLIQLMNDFLTPMSDLVMENRGTIDKYMGDAMMAFWNAPLDDTHHAYHACKAALGMREALRSLNKKNQSSNVAFPVLKAGIGINTGPCSVGNMGSKQRFAYSALGDAVNLASRLEGQTRHYGIDILIGHETACAPKVKDLAILEADCIQVKGKNQPEQIYALAGDEKLAQDAGFKSLRKAHQDMREAYQNGLFDEACALAKTCEIKEEFGLSHFYELYIERCEALQEKAPENWDGVYIAQSK